MSNKKCPQCGREIKEVFNRKIIDRARNDFGKAYVRTTPMEFCSPRCGAHYQMGCEG